MAGTKSLSQRDFSNQKGINLVDGTAATDAASKGQLDTAYTNAASRANHTGTQLAATVSDFDTQVRSSRLDQLAQPTNPVPFNSQRATSLLDPTSAQDAATKNYVDNQISGLTNGLAFKGSVRAATTAQVSTSAAPATIDGLTPQPGDIFLLMGNTTPADNGPRVWTAAGAAMARASNWNSSAKATLGSFWDIREGTYADLFALCTNDAAITLGTDALSFVVRGQASAASGYTTTLPTTTAGGTALITHNLNSKYITAQVARVASPYDFVDVRIERTSLTTVTVLPDVAINAGDYEIMIAKVA